MHSATSLHDATLTTHSILTAIIFTAKPRAAEHQTNIRLQFVDVLPSVNNRNIAKCARLDSAVVWGVTLVRVGRSTKVSASADTGLTAVFNCCRGAVLSVCIFFGLINVLALTSSIYMLQLYDRVIPAHSIPTLVALTMLMLLLFAGYGVLDMVRIRIMSRIGLRLDRLLRERIFGLVLALPLRTRGEGDGLQPVRDLDQLRSFLISQGPIALFDLPWIPFYLALVLAEPDTTPERPPCR
jgi:ABC-type bacteriocin/lantibiotic exporter with double-glycine peptidase domain